jgi:UDP-N-acetylmuramoyl-tripeptide--D-alanyl-D-alanine ligase
MIPLTLAEIARAIGGTLHDTDGTPVVTGTVEFDSRKVTEGGLFVAIPGERVDGHDFAATAIRDGAVGVLAARPVGVPAIVVPPVTGGPSRSVALTGDTDGSGAAVLAGLGALARTVVDRLTDTEGLAVIGVTGSSGKTSTKDLIAQVLAPLGATVAPPGSFNSELGHPWTALRADAKTDHLVLEMSARGVGHIRAACETTPPRIGVVLNVGTAHLGEFGSREAIAQTKGELVEALPLDGLAVLNADDPLVAGMASRTKARVVLVGASENAEIRAVDVTLDEQARARFHMLTPVGAADVALTLHGRHHVGNALAAAAVALELGATPELVAQSLSGAKRMSERRMDVRTAADGVTVVNDSYNANPESMRAALATLAEMGRTEARRRTWAVLGVMGELGDEAVAAHDELGRLVARLDINKLVAVGAGADVAAIQQGASRPGRSDSLGEESVLVPDVDAAVALLREQLRPGDIVLVKASKVAALWRVADALLGDAA